MQFSSERFRCSDDAVTVRPSAALQKSVQGLQFIPG